MSESKSGWPLTKEFAEGMTAFGARFTEGVMALREVALDALEAMVTSQEAMAILQAKVAYANATGSRASYWELYAWARDNGRPNLASFLYTNRHNHRITGLFGSEQPTDEPPEGS